MHPLYLNLPQIPSIPSDALSQPRFDLPKFSGKPSYKCLVASTPRSGSSLLGRLLHENGLGVPNEYLHPSVHIPFLAHRWGLIEAGKVNLSLYLQTCFQYRTTQEGVFTCKAHWNQFQPFFNKGVLQRYFEGTRFVMIRRRDLLGQAISHEIASQTGQWSSYWPKSKEPAYSKESIRKRMQAVLNENANWRMFFAQNDINWLEVVYEDLLRDPLDMIQKVIDHLIPEFGLQANASIESSGISKQRNSINQCWRERFVREASNWIIDMR